MSKHYDFGSLKKGMRSSVEIMDEFFKHSAEAYSKRCYKKWIRMKCSTEDEEITGSFRKGNYNRTTHHYFSNENEHLRKIEAKFKKENEKEHLGDSIKQQDICVMKCYDKRYCGIEENRLKINWESERTNYTCICCNRSKGAKGISLDLKEWEGYLMYGYNDYLHLGVGSQMRYYNQSFLEEAKFCFECRAFMKHRHNMEVVFEDIRNTQVLYNEPEKILFQYRRRRWGMLCGQKMVKGDYADIREGSDSLSMCLGYEMTDETRKKIYTDVSLMKSLLKEWNYCGQKSIHFNKDNWITAHNKFGYKVCWWEHFGDRKDIRLKYKQAVDIIENQIERPSKNHLAEVIYNYRMKQTDLDDIIV
tara:strand:- start:1926 stop:3008 length:1083 start_codon:yes stop_codon:yes gene_type:complete